MTRRRSRLLDVDLGSEASVRFRGLSKHPVTKRLEGIIARQMREALREALNEAMDNAARDGSFPSRSGRGYAAVRGRAQAFGTNFRSLRGHITAPLYLVAHDRGATITPKSSNYLTVPVFEALRADGTPKLASARSWIMLGSFVYRSKRTGQLYIARRTAEGKLSVLYLLLTEAQLKKHKGWAQAAWQRQLPSLSVAWGNILMNNITVDMVEEAYVQGGGSF